jgi:hypothetical protein
MEQLDIFTDLTTDKSDYIDPDFKKMNQFTFVGAGGSHRSDGTLREQHDFYASPPKCAPDLLNKMDEVGDPIMGKIWEPADGVSSLSNEFERNGFEVVRSDLIKRHDNLDFVGNFMNTDQLYAPNIITNPPFDIGKNFAYHGLSLNPDKFALLMKIQFLESKNRKEFIDTYPPKWVFPYTQRVVCARNAEFEKYTSSAMMFAWFVWVKDYQGYPMISLI